MPALLSLSPPGCGPGPEQSRRAALRLRPCRFPCEQLFQEHIFQASLSSEGAWMLFPSPGARHQPAEGSRTQSPPALPRAACVTSALTQLAATLGTQEAPRGPAGVLQRRGAAFQLHSSCIPAGITHCFDDLAPGGDRTLSSLQGHSVLGEEASGTCCLLLGFGDVLFVDLSS